MAVNPDQRYSHLAGSKATNPLTGEELPVVTSRLVAGDQPARLANPSLGPEHWTLCQVEGLGLRPTFSPEDLVVPRWGIFRGLTRGELASKTKQLLSDQGLYRGEEDAAEVVKISKQFSDIVDMVARADMIELVLFVTSVLSNSQSLVN